MKNLLIYINPTKDFDKEHKILAKIQIDNCLDLKFEKKDIILITNFNYQYNGIKASILENIEFFEPAPKASKINVIIKLIENGTIKNNETYWFHDFDAYQLYQITESDLAMKGFDMALTDYGRMPRWNTGSIFFNKNVLDILKLVKDIVYQYKTDEESALMAITENNLRWTTIPSSLINSYKPVPTNIDNLENILKRILKLNISYNFTGFNLRSCYNMASKPLKVTHFHPLKGIEQLGIKNAYHFFLGENKIHTPLIPDRLIKIFNHHGIK